MKTKKPTLVNAAARYADLIEGCKALAQIYSPCGTRDADKENPKFLTKREVALLRAAALLAEAE